MVQQCFVHEIVCGQCDCRCLQDVVEPDQVWVIVSLEVFALAIRAGDIFPDHFLGDGVGKLAKT